MSSGPMQTTVLPMHHPLLRKPMLAESLILFAHMANPTFRLLVVDDDALSRDLLALLLNREGYVIDVLDSGDAAFEALSQRYMPVPDAVLTDLQMPGTSGSKLARNLRQVCGDTTRLIAMSASKSPATALDGFDAFLSKPFTMEALANTLTATASTTSASNAAPVRQNVTVLDQTVYDRLAGSMRPDTVDQLYALFLADAQRRKANLREAANQKDDPAFRSEAHALKGGCSLVGAVELQMIAASLETGGIPANYVATLDEILLACDRLQRMLVARKQYQVVPLPRL
jgi:CheY-like chemotaxis protein